MPGIAKVFNIKISLSPQLFIDQINYSKASQKWHRIDCGAIDQKERGVLKEFKGIWIPYDVLVDKKLNDKEKRICKN